MGEPRKFFRGQWRIYSVLIILALLAVGSFIVHEMGIDSVQDREADAGIPVNGVDPKADLVLSSASFVPGTQVMRAELQRNDGARFSSGGSGEYRETRNILFIEPGQKTAHWLLPDNDHVIDTTDIEETKQPNGERVVATAALVKSPSPSPEIATGKLLLFDPPGRKVVAVADGVRAIQIASLSGDELNLLYERDKRLFLDVFDAQSITKLREQEIEIPPVK
jgi:hypothetical protein